MFTPAIQKENLEAVLLLIENNDNQYK